MSIPGDVFEPIVIQNILKNLQKGASERKLFEKKWEENVCLSVKEVPAHWDAIADSASSRKLEKEQG